MVESEDAIAVIGIGCNFPGGESTKVGQPRLFKLYFSGIFFAFPRSDSSFKSKKMRKKHSILKTSQDR